MRRLGFALVVLGMGLGGCLQSTGGNDFGATPGGVKDLHFARAMVEEGHVPPKDSLLVEAMFAEHDLPIVGAPCEETLCLRSAIGRAPNLAGEARGWAQIGLSSSIDPDTFVRPPTSFVATVDVSGSMGWGGQGGTPGEIARKLLTELTTQMGPNDRFALVTYGSDVDVVLSFTAGDDPSIKQEILDLSEAGSTNMEAGLEKAFDLAEEEAAKGRPTRVLLFTDEQPNVGATSSTEFETMVAKAGSHDVGLTVFGLGLGLGAELMKNMAHLRGGNAFSLTEVSEIEPFMKESWPWFTVPIAYDLKVAVKPTDGVSVVGSYGFPEGTNGLQSLELASVFLSKKRGGILLELDGSLSAESGVDLELSYKTPEAETRTAMLAPRVGASQLDASGVSMPQPGVARATSLAIFTAAMHDAAETYENNHSVAADALDLALGRLDTDATATGDADLTTEHDFWKKLSDLMHANAPQGNMYGGVD